MPVIILLLGSFFAAVISGAAGFGGSLLLLPVATACVGAELAVPLLTIAQLLGNLARVSTGYREIAWRYVGLFSLTALPLAALGAFGFSLLPKATVIRFVGVGLIVLVLLGLCAKKELPAKDSTFLIGGALTGGLSGLVGSGGPIGAAVFLSLGLNPVGYIASEAMTAVGMHIIKTIVYGKLTGMTLPVLLLGCGMGAAMFAGTYTARHFIKNMPKARFKRYVAVLLLAIGTYMTLTGNK